MGGGARKIVSAYVPMTYGTQQSKYCAIMQEKYFLYFLMFRARAADTICRQGKQWRKKMNGFILVLCMFGYGAGYEGYDDGKHHIGVYTPSCEYGWVVTDKEIYLDTIYQKNFQE